MEETTSFNPWEAWPQSRAPQATESFTACLPARPLQGSRALSELLQPRGPVVRQKAATRHPTAILPAIRCSSSEQSHQALTPCPQLTAIPAPGAPREGRISALSLSMSYLRWSSPACDLPPAAGMPVRGAEAAKAGEGVRLMVKTTAKPLNEV